MSNPFNFVWFQGVVEVVGDEKKADRVRVRAIGFHTEDKNELPSDLLPWASFLAGGADMSSPMVLPGDWVVGFFLDGNEAQKPIVIGKIPGIPASRDNTAGFSDPAGIYPKRLNEPTTSRSARGDASDAQAYKDSSAWGNPTGYAAKYPFNHVIETDKGAMFELDDTEGAERVCIFHHKGSYVEFLPDGTIVVKSTGNRWDVTFKDHNMLINGNLTVGATGDIKFAAGGDMKFSAGGTTNIAAGGEVNLGAGGGVSIVGGGQVAVNGSRFDWGSAGDATGGPDAVEGPGATDQYTKP